MSKGQRKGARKSILGREHCRNESFGRMRENMVGLRKYKQFGLARGERSRQMRQS